MGKNIVNLSGIWKGVKITEEDIAEGRAELLEWIERRWDRYNKGEKEMSEYEFSEVEEKKIAYYSKIMCEIYVGITKYAPSLAHDDAIGLIVPIFHAVIKSDAAESLNKIAAEAMGYLREKQEEAGKAAEEARESLSKMTMPAMPTFKLESPTIHAMRSVFNAMIDALADAESEKEKGKE